MQFHSKPVEEHGEVPLDDRNRLEAVLPSPPVAPSDQTRCYVVSVGDWRSPTHERAQLAEILGLVEALGDSVVGHETLKLTTPHPRTHLGPGTCELVAARARAAGATLLVLDAALSPSQTRDLEDATGFPISDREIVILGVFQRHARSKTARIQVEIARLQFLRPRIRGLGLDMDQQSGAGTNQRGAGETASELLARQLDRRLVVLRKDLVRLEASDALRRRGRAECGRIALVGYTNAGKTSLMNALTGTDLSVRSRPFETLDTTSRCLTRHGGDVLIGDTVGFIRDLPERLRASFASTLAEARHATLLAVVLDLSDPEWPMHLQTTTEQLDHIGAGDLPRVIVFNKADRVPRPHPLGVLAAAAGPWPFEVVSAWDAEAVSRVREVLIARARRGHQTVRVFVPYGESDGLDTLYSKCRILETEATDEGLWLSVEGPALVLAPFVEAS